MNKNRIVINFQRMLIENNLWSVTLTNVLFVSLTIFTYWLFTDLFGYYIIVSLILIFLVDNFLLKPKLLKICYSGRNRHLFTKYNLIYELITAVALTSLFFFVPTLLDFSEISPTSTKRLQYNLLLVWFSFFAGIQKYYLLHIRSVWEANRNRTKFHLIRGEFGCTNKIRKNEAHKALLAKYQK